MSTKRAGRWGPQLDGETVVDRTMDHSDQAARLMLIWQIHGNEPEVIQVWRADWPILEDKHRCGGITQGLDRPDPIKLVETHGRVCPRLQQSPGESVSVLGQGERPIVRDAHWRKHCDLAEDVALLSGPRICCHVGSDVSGAHMTRYGMCVSGKRGDRQCRPGSTCRPPQSRCLIGIEPQRPSDLAVRSRVRRQPDWVIAAEPVLPEPKRCGPRDRGRLVEEFAVTPGYMGKRPAAIMSCH